MFELYGMGLANRLVEVGSNMSRPFQYAVVPFLVGVVCFSCLLLAAPVFGFDTMRFPMPPISSLVAGMEEASSRTAWAASALSLIVSCVLLTALSIAVFHRNINRMNHPRRTLLLLVPWVFSIAAALAAFLIPVSGGLMRSIFESIEAVTNRHPPVLSLVKSLGALAAGTSLWLFFALSSTLIEPGKGRRHTEIALKMREANGLLHLTALALAVGVTEITLLIRWPASFIVDTSIQHSLLHLASSQGLATGFAYTFGLLVVFMPVGAIHEHWRDDICRQLAETDRRFERSVWEKNMGLDRSAFSVLGALLAVAAPLIAGAVIGQLAAR